MLRVLPVLLLLLPPVLADATTPGIPDASCQTPADWRVHDYGAPLTGGTITGLTDGNTQACPTTGAFDGDKEYAQGGAVLAARTGDGVTFGSLVCLDTVAHHSVGGTLRVLDTVVGVVTFTVAADASAVPPLFGPDCGDGVIEPCAPGSGPSLGAPTQGPGATSWAISGQTCNPADQSRICLDTCIPSFAPGANGAYLVFVDQVATQGHVTL